MRRLPGQAARFTARLLHRLAGLALAVALLAGAGAALLGWRLSQGPVQLPWLVQRLEAAVNAEAGGARLTVGGAALAWEGFSQGVDRPLDLRIRDIAVTDPNGQRVLSMPSAEVSLSLLALLTGRVEPRAVEIDRARIRVYRAEDGTLSLELQPPAEAGAAAGEAAIETEPQPEPAGPGVLARLLAELERPAGSDRAAGHNPLRQLRRVRVYDAEMVVVDRQLSAIWHAPRADIDLVRGADGGVQGRGELTVSLGDQTARLTVTADLAAGGTSTHLQATLSPVAPAALARSVPALAPLSALDAPVGAMLTADLGPTLRPRHVEATVRVGSGSAHIGSASIRLADAVFVASGDADAVTLDSARIALIGHDGATPTVLSATGAARRQPDRIHAQLALSLDQVAFADLPHLWPEGMGGGARGWITENITAGSARNGHVEAELDIAPDFSDAALTAAHGTLDGDGLTVWWLRPIPPIDQGVAQLRILDPDTLEIAVQGGRQRAEGAKAAPGSGGLVVRGGTVRITGIEQHDQFGKIDADIAGPLPDALAVLRAPRLHLFDHVALDLKDPAGQVTSAHLSVALPMEDKVTMDAIVISAQARLDGAHLGGLVAGFDLDDGAVDLKVTNDGMTVTGTAALGTIPAKLDAAMDFRAGPPTQVLQTVKIAGQPSAAQLSAIALNPGGMLAGGAAGLTATLTERRDGQGLVVAAADLTGAAMRLDLAGWTKPAGTAGQASAKVRLDHDRLSAIDDIRLAGAGADLRGHATFTAGKASVLQVDRLVLGKTSATGSVRFPGPSGGPIRASVAGSTIDLSARLSYHAPKGAGTTTDRANAAASSGPGQAWALDARFDHAIMANDETFSGLVLSAEDDGTRLTRLRLDARAGGQAPIMLEIAPGSGGRRLTATAADAGGLLRALDVTTTMQGGRLSITGSFDDRSADEPLTGSAEIEDFRIRDAPAMARLLQAMTLYGLVDLVSGPGLGFTKLIAPFRLSGSVLELTEARAFSSSLGLTAKGRVDLANDRAEIDGTVVPAYFFNSLLGNVPLIGKLFSPETGGGVFAANYSVRGSLSDPIVSVNPLAALTPGFLRGLFGNL